MGIPADNIDDLIDQIILKSPEVLGQIEIYAMLTMEDAIALARRDRADAYLEATNIFSDVALVLDDENWKDDQDITSQLDQILALCPNHVSAQLLKDLQNDALRKRLSLTQSILYLNDIFAQYIATIRQEAEPSFKDIQAETTLTHINKTIDDLNDAKPMLHTDANTVHSKMVQTCRTIAKYIGDGKKIARQKKILDKRQNAIEKAQAVLVKYKARLNTTSRASVTKHNNQVNRINNSIRGYERDQADLNDLIQQRQETLAQISETYADYMAAVQELVQDQEILEKLVRGQ